MAMGVPAGYIIIEQKSGTTFSQLKNIASIISKRQIKSINIISNEFHLPRIKTMLAYAPELPKLYKSVKVKLVSAEKICLRYDSKKWESIARPTIISPAMKQRIKLEQKGIGDMKAGRYRFK